MSLHRLLAHLNGALVPNLGADAKPYAGWFARLRHQLHHLRTHPPVTLAAEAAEHDKLRALFLARPDDMKRYLDDFDRTRQPITPMLPGTSGSVGSVPIGHLPTNESAALPGQTVDAITALAGQLVAAIDAELPPAAAAEEPA